MTTPGVDWAWGRPDIRTLKAIGERFAARYLSHDASKNLSLAEASILSAAGIWIVVVWETTATRAADGYAAGVQDAHDAKDQAAACGMPSDRPIYFAVDYDAAVSDVEPYFRGAVSVLGVSRVGVYGGIRVVSGLLDARLCTFAWQASAWSYGQWDSRADIRQGGQHTIAGVDCDDDTAMTNAHPDYGQWQVGRSPQQPPAQQEEDMPYGQLAEGKQAITPITLGKKYTKLQFTADNGLQHLPGAVLRVAVHKGGGNWGLQTVTVDGAKDEVVVDVTGGEGVSVRREDAGDVHVSYAVVA